MRGCKPRRRTQSHANLSQKSLFMWLLGANIEKRRSPEVRWWRGRHSHPHNKKKMKIGKERKVASGHVESDLRYHRQRCPMSPSIYIIAGPNGVGKTTFAREFLPNYANCRHFISADPIAVALSRIKGRYFDASLVGERTSTRFDGNPRLSVLSEARTDVRSGLVSTHTNAIGNANCDILTVKRGGKDGAF